jgi:protein gp37
MVFVNSMSDLFHTYVPDEYILRVTQVMITANWHTYQVLTKRADRLESLLTNQLRFGAEAKNIWWGVSVENKKHGLPRIEHLRKAPAQVRFLSVEPLLEDLGEIDLSGIHWVIVGGESGHGARPMKRDWVINILRQCQKQGSKFFFKQWGGVHKSKTGRLLDGRTYDEFPETIQNPIASLSVRRSYAASID